MNWGSDELHHRSAELSGWCAELRAADPEDVDDTIPGAVAYAAETTPHSGDADPPDTETDVGADTDADTRTGTDADDADDPADAPDAADAACGTDGSTDATEPPEPNTESDSPDDPDGYVCSLCGGDIPDGEALDAEGAPIDVGFVWLADVEAYHRSCIEEGEGRYLPWAANGVLRDESTG